MNTTTQQTAPSLPTRIAAAMFICSLGAEKTGVRTKRQLMHPITEFSNDECQKDATELVIKTLLALLKAAPPQVFERIQKHQDEQWSFYHEPPPHNETSHNQAL